jgi:Rrf2 family protein
MNRASGSAVASSAGYDMKISRTVGYALQATLQLAQTRSPAPVPCSQLAAEGKMPERFLLQVLRSLVTHGILRSTRGVEGGYALQRSPEEISLLEVIEAIEGPLEAPPSPVEAAAEPPMARLKSELERIASATRQQLEAIKLSQLLKAPKK